MEVEVSPADVAAAELAGGADLLQRVVGACHARCIVGAKDGSLSIAEMSCTDRCALKYFETHKIVGNVLKKSAGVG